MDDLLLKNELFRHFEERTTVELRMALDEVKWWNELAAQGLIKPEEAQRHVESARRIIKTKLHVLGFPEFPS
jgi:hypothetical protein